MSSFSSSSKSSISKNNETESEKNNKNFEYVDRGLLGFRLYRVHGITYDYVERDNGVGTGEVCSLYGLRKGNFHIYDKATGKVITENEIPWRN